MEYVVDVPASTSPEAWEAIRGVLDTWLAASRQAPPMVLEVWRTEGSQAAGTPKCVRLTLVESKVEA